MFWDSIEKNIIFPIKREYNLYEQNQNPEMEIKRQYIGGYPALFGGNSKGSIKKTLKEEVDEESRYTYKFTGADDDYKPIIILEKLKKELNIKIPDRMQFFYTRQTYWEETNNPWPSTDPKKRDEGEMLRVATVSLTKFPRDLKDPKQILEKLILESQSPQPVEKKAEFLESGTAAAFVQFIESWRTNRLP